MQQGTPVSGIIQDAKMSQSGKSLGIKVNGKWYSTKEFHWQGQVGKNVSFIGNYQSFGDGGVTWANDIVLADAPGPNSSAPPQAPQAPPPAYSPPPSYTGTSQMGPAAANFEPAQALPMTSNIVAHAIQAGLIKTPLDIAAWASAGFNAAKGLITTGTARAAGMAQPAAPTQNDNEFDDDIPF